MGAKIILSLFFIIFAIILLVLYWFIPITTTKFDFSFKPQNYTFNPDKQDWQFYNNMRFPEKRISYKIGDCPLQKKEDMERAFELLENFTILDFYSVKSNEQITVVCDSHTKIEGGLFIAGEGGPTNITTAGNFNVIAGGRILLLRESPCPTPNIALHELLHVLGFNHSENPGSIMYPVSNCDQIVDTSIITLINKLYEVPNYPDLAFENVSAIMHGKYLNVNISIRNVGLQNSLPVSLQIFADDELIKQMSLDSLIVGTGRIISLTNVWVNQLSVNKLEFFIDSSFEELKKENNKVVLEIKK